MGPAHLAPCPRTRTQSAAQWGHCCLGGTGRRIGKAGAGRKRTSQVQIPELQWSAGSEGPGGLRSNKPMVRLSAWDGSLGEDLGGAVVAGVAGPCQAHPLGDASRQLTASSWGNQCDNHRSSLNLKTQLARVSGMDAGPGPT